MQKRFPLLQRKETIGNFMEVRPQIRKLLMPLLTRFWRQGVSTMWRRVWECRTKSKKFYIPSKEGRLNPSVRLPGTCRYHVRRHTRESPASLRRREYPVRDAGLHSGYIQTVATTTNFTIDMLMLHRIYTHPGFFPCISFSDHATFHLAGEVNQHNLLGIYRLLIAGLRQPYCEHLVRLIGQDYWNLSNSGG